MKLCIDCKHFKLRREDCSVPTLGRDLVTGEIYTVSARIERKKYNVYLHIGRVDSCGPEASHFEPKEPSWLKKLFKRLRYAKE